MQKKNILSHDFFMQIAYQQALLAYEAKEIPVGAVIVAQNKVIAKTHNQTERLQDVTAHAEVLAITAASQYLGNKYLHNCTLYVTLEPCTMCAGALYWSQISQIVYAVSDENRGFSKNNHAVLHPKTSVLSGVLEEPCKALLQKFFKTLRN